MGKNTIKQEFSAGGVIARKDKNNNIEILIIEDSFGQNAFPKGHVENNESIEETAEREIFEEVGLKKLKLITEIGTNEYYFTDKFNNNAKIHKFVRYFLFMTDYQSKIKVQKEEGIKNPRWIPLNILDTTVSYENLKRIAKKTKECLKNFYDH